MVTFVVDILHAVQTNDCDTVEWALESGVFDLDQRDVAGLTLTMIAARQGKYPPMIGLSCKCYKNKKLCKIHIVCVLD